MKRLLTLLLCAVAMCLPSPAAVRAVDSVRDYRRANERRSLNPRLLEARSAAAPPVVYGELLSPGAARTLVFYAHYDGQPTDPQKWTGTQPWQPTLRSSAAESGGRIIPMPK